MRRIADKGLQVLGAAQQARDDLTRQSRDSDDFQKVLEIRARKMQSRYGVLPYSFDEFDREFSLEKPKSLPMRLAEGGFKAVIQTAAFLAVSFVLASLFGANVSELAKPMAEWSNRAITALVGVSFFAVALGVNHTVQADNSAQVKNNNLERYNEYLNQTELTLAKQNQKEKGVDVQATAPARSATHFRDMIAAQESAQVLQGSRG